MNMDQDRYQREKSFHDDRFGSDDSLRAPAQKYYVVNKEMDQYFKDRIGKLCRGKKLLEYGCGTGSNAFHFSSMGADVTGIDISNEGVLKAKDVALKKGVDCQFEVMNAEDLSFNTESYDLIIGTGILHHLDLQRSYSEIARVLKIDGRALFCEPLGHNPLINWYRYRTPEMRTIDEHPLLRGDMALARIFFDVIELKAYSFVTIALVPFANYKYFPFLYSLFKRVDEFIFKFVPGGKWLAWYMVCEFSSPNKESLKSES